MSTDVEALARAELEHYCGLKRGICEDAHGPDDCMPFLTLGFSDGFRVVAALAGPGHPADALVPVIRMVREESGRGDPVFAIFAVETHIKYESPKDHFAARYERGDFQREFERDPRSSVHEALVVHVVSAAGMLAMLECKYGYDDHGLPVFEEPVLHGHGLMGTNGVTGLIPDALMRAMR